jgi:hypothetical protein
MKVKLTKIGTPPNCKYETASREEYALGEPNDKSPFIDYWLEGVLMAPIEEGDMILIDRTSRNGEPIRGFFHSSRILKTEGNKIFTQNSIYEIEYLERRA